MKSEKPGFEQVKVTATGFFSLFSIVGIALYGLPFFYDFWVQDFGWSRATVTSGNAFGKVIIGMFAFFAGWVIDRFGPRRVMIFGIIMGGMALIGLSRVTSLWQYYFFYLFYARRIYVWRSIAEPGTYLQVVYQCPRQSHGHCLPGHRHRRNAGAADRKKTQPGIRMAPGNDDAGHTDDHHCFTHGMVRKG